MPKKKHRTKSKARAQRYYHLYQFAYPREAHEFVAVALLLVLGIALYNSLLHHIAQAATSAATTPPTVAVTAPPTTTSSASGTIVFDATLDTTSPPAGNVPPGQPGVVFAVAKVSTTNGVLQVNSFSVTATPPGAPGLKNIKLFDGNGTQLGPTITNLPGNVSSPTVEVSGVSFALASGATKFITLQADVLPNAKGSVSLALSGINYSSSSSVLLRGLPVVGHTMEITTTPPPPAPQPDLVVSSLYLAPSAQVYAGYPFDADDVTVIVKNQGAASSQPARLQLNLRGAQSNQLLCSWADSIPTLTAGASRSLTPNHNSFMNCPPLTAQSYYLEAVADISAAGLSQVAESNEANNVSHSDSFVAAPAVGAPQVSGVSLVRLPQTGGSPQVRISFMLTSSAHPTATLLYRDDTLYQPTARSYNHSRPVLQQANGSFAVDLSTATTEITHYAVVVTHTNVLSQDYAATPAALTGSVRLPAALTLYAGYPFYGDDVSVSVKNQTAQALPAFTVALNVREAATNNLQCSWSQPLPSLAAGAVRQVEVAPSAFLRCPPLKVQDYYLELGESPTASNPQPVALIHTDSFTVLPQSAAPQVSDLTTQIFSSTRAQLTFTVASPATSSYTPTVELLYSDEPGYVYNVSTRRYNKSRLATHISGSPRFRVDLTFLLGGKHYAVHATRTNVITPDRSW